MWVARFTRNVSRTQQFLSSLGIAITITASTILLYAKFLLIVPLKYSTIKSSPSSYHRVSTTVIERSLTSPKCVPFGEFSLSGLVFWSAVQDETSKGYFSCLHIQIFISDLRNDSNYCTVKRWVKFDCFSLHPYSCSCQILQLTREKIYNIITRFIDSVLIQIIM